MAKVDRSILLANNQEMGQFGDPNKLENSISHVADKVDENYDGFNAHKEAIELPHADKSVTEEKLGDNSVSKRTIQPGAVGATELDPAILAQPTSALGVQAKLQEVDEQLAHIATNITNFILAPETDWTLAIRRAIEATPKGGTLLIPANSQGYYVKNQTEKYLFKIDKPMTILGYGITSFLILDENIPTDTDIFLFSPPDNGVDIRGYNIKGVTVIGRNGSSPARHAVHLDTTLSGQKIANSVIKGNFFYPTGGWSIYLTNPTNTDGYFTSQIQKNLIYSGIYLQRGGDSLTITENTIAGYNSVDISLVDGSNTLIIAFNNITCRKGVILRSGNNVKLIYNNIECGYADSVYENGAMVDIDGLLVPYTYGMLSVEIHGNSFGFRAATAPVGVKALRVNNTRGLDIRNNFFGYDQAAQIEITNSAEETRIGYNLYSYDTPDGVITDNGRNTIKESVHIANPLSGARELYEILSPLARWKINTMWNLLDTQNIESITANNAPTFNHIWQAANTFNSKYKFQTQLRNADGTLATAKPYAYLGDGYQYFVNGGFALVSPDGSRWKVNVDNAGNLTTTKM